LAIGAALAAGVACYLFLLPHHVGESDEADFLYHAKRVLDGQVPHRDFYELHMTLPYYLMAAAFWLFGTTVVTSTAAAAVVQGLIAWGIYAAARALGAGRGFALVAAVAHPALDALVWPYASPHWIATLVLVGLLWFLTSRGARTNRDWFVAGTLVGLLGVIQHQNAAPVALALRPRLVAYAAGCALIPLPYLLLHVGLAGWPDLVDQVIVHPFRGYRAQVTPRPWGSSSALTRHLEPYTVMPYLRVLPAMLPLLLARAVAATRRGHLDLAWRLSAALVLISGASASILYYPDFIHVGFIAPLYLPAVAEAAQWVVERAAARWPAARRVGTVTTSVLLVLLAGHAATNFRQFHAEYDFEFDTAFGRMAARRAWVKDEVTKVIAEVNARKTSELFCYPVFPLLNLATGTDNPTRHDTMFERLSAPAHYDEVIAVLDAHRTPLVHLTAHLLDDRSGDRFVQYVERHYRCAEPRPEGSAPPARPGIDCTLYERIDAS
jgi:hypothetical protein